MHSLARLPCRLVFYAESAMLTWHMRSADMGQMIYHAESLDDQQQPLEICVF